MEWDLKMPAWDLQQLEQNAGEANLSSVVGYSGSSTGRHSGRLDLKLGGLGDFGLADRWKEQRRGSPMATAPPPAAAKRPRAPPRGCSQNVSCLVDGCRNDLSNCREYHRRHKVCEVHSKTPIVLVGGQEQRFCQQCSRFHLLVEFDEVKRSCRKRLDGHNRRRRKQQPDLMNSGNLSATHHGTRFTSYPQIFPTAAIGTTWTTIAKSEDNAHYSQHPPPMHLIDGMQQTPQRLQHFGSSFNWNFKEGKQFPFFTDGGEIAPRSSTAMKPTVVCQPHLKAISSAAESSSCKTMFSGGLPPVLDSDCALSLLSSSTETLGISLGHVVPVDRIPIGQPLFSSLEYDAGIGRYPRSQAPSHNVSTTGFSCSGIDTVLVSDTSEADLHCHKIFHVGGEGSSDGASQSLPFSWQ